MKIKELTPSKATNSEEVEFEQTSFYNGLKSTTISGKQDFVDGGFVQIGMQFFPTKIVGDQRWITVDYTAQISGQTFSNGGTIHHSYEAAMSLDGSSTIMNMYAPTGLVENSNWRIPSWSDMNHLGSMTYGDSESAISNLNLTSTGMVQWDDSYDASIATHVNPTLSVFWNSDFIDATSYNNGTWHLTATNATDYLYLFQYQTYKPYAPIRLVQDVEPL